MVPSSNLFGATLINYYFMDESQETLRRGVGGEPLIFFHLTLFTEFLFHAGQRAKCHRPTGAYMHSGPVGPILDGSHSRAVVAQGRELRKS